MGKFQIRKAEKGKQKLRLGLIGPTGSGKTWTSLLFAESLVEGTGLRIGVIDTERESSELYADRFDFDVIQLTESHDPRAYIDALHAFAETGQHGCVVVDSVSHAWMGREGALEQVDKAAARSKSGNSFAAWRNVTPLHNQLVDALLAQPYHLIATLRAKMEYVQEKDKDGRTEVRKIGLQPVQRDGMEYEFTVVCDIDTDHKLVVGKTRCNDVDGVVIHRPDGKFAHRLRTWIESGIDKPAAPKPAAANGWAEDPATPGQLSIIDRILKSHVFTDEERAQTKAALTKHNTKTYAGECIERITKVVDERKAAEKREAVQA